jgi:hypothetical protein
MIKLYSNIIFITKHTEKLKQNKFIASECIVYLMNLEL